MVKRYTQAKGSPQDLPGAFLSQRFVEELFCFVSDPRAFAVKTRDPERPSFNEAVQGEFSQPYVDVDNKEII